MYCIFGIIVAGLLFFLFEAFGIPKIIVGILEASFVAGWMISYLSPKVEILDVCPSCGYPLRDKPVRWMRVNDLPAARFRQDFRN
jgi:hypothetical protein